jgi:hypothetical protein
VAKKAELLDREQHRQLAVGLFDLVWMLLETPDRTPMQDDEMIHAAHASRFHWGKVGEGPRLARAEWQCSWVYAELERPEPALYHARRCEALCNEYESELEDFDLPAMHEAFARAQLLAGNREEVLRHIALARELCAEISDPDDRDIIQAQIDSIAPLE